MKRDLGSMEQALLVADAFSALTVLSVLRLANGSTPEVLQQALAMLQRRHPLLRAKIGYQNGRPAFEISESAPPIPVHVVDWQDDRQWQVMARAELNQCVDTTIAPLLRCTYLYGAGDNTPSDLIVAYHHTIMDAASGIRLHHQLLSWCAAIAAGTDIAAGDDQLLPLLPAAENLFPPTFKGVRRWWRMLPFLWRQMCDEVAYQKPASHGQKAPIHSASTCDILTLCLPTATTTALVRRARREHVTMNSVLAAAMLMTVHTSIYNARTLPLRGITFANLRPYLKPPIPDDRLGCYITMSSYTVPMHHGITFWNVARFIHNKTYQFGKSGDKFLAATISKQLMQTLIRFQRFRMGTIALSYVGPVDLEPVYGTIRVRGLHGFTANNRLGPVYVAFAKILHGQLLWDLQYLTADMDRQTAQVLVDNIRAILKTAME